ncbi:MAG: ABC transporter substrate-binding protein, partial [Anaerolineae bacterium]
MRRWALTLVTALALALISVPLAAEGQKAVKVYRIGFLTGALGGLSIAQSAEVVGWLQEFGYVEGRNIAFEYRHALGADEQLRELAADLVRLKVDVIVTAGTGATRAAKQATRRIPIVMAVGGDPVKARLIASLARPGGNITGLTALVPELSGKRLQLLKEAVPGLMRVGILWNPTDPAKVEERKATQEAARVLGLELQSLEVRSQGDFDSAFEAAVDRGANGLLVLADALTAPWAKLITELAAKRRLPSMYSIRWFVEGGGRGLMSYGPSRTELSRRVAM